MNHADAQHGFTNWGTGPFSAYNAMADSRSWWSMMALFDTLSSEAAMGDDDDETYMEEDMDEEDHKDGEDHDHSHDEEDMDMDDSSANGLSVFGAVAISTLLAALAC